MKRSLVAALLCLSLPAVSSSDADPASRAAESYKRAAEFLEPGGRMYVYLSLDAFREKLDMLFKAIPQMLGEDAGEVMLVRDVLVKAGLGDIRDYGFSLLPRADGTFRISEYIGFEDAHRGVLWSLLAPTGDQPLPGLALAPANAMFVMGLRPDMPKFVDGLMALVSSTPMKEDMDEMISEAGEEGVDLPAMLRDSGSEWLLAFDLAAKPGAEPMPVLLVACKPTGPAFLKNVAQIVQVSEMPLGPKDPTLPEGFELLAADECPPGMQMCWGSAGGWFIFATHTGVAKAAIARMNGQMGGLAQSEEFKALAAGLPRKGSCFAFVGKKVAEVLRGLMHDAGGPAGAAMSRLMFPPDAKTGALSVCEVGPDAIRTRTHSYTDPMGDLLFLPAAIALPALQGAKANAQRAACMNNLRQINAATQQYMLENNTTTVPPFSKLTEYFMGGKMPVCPLGGVYSQAETEDGLPRCSLEDSHRHTINFR